MSGKTELCVWFPTQKIVWRAWPQTLRELLSLFTAILTPVCKHRVARRTGEAAQQRPVALHAAVCMYGIANICSPCSYNLSNLFRRGTSTQKGS